MKLDDVQNPISVLQIRNTIQVTIAKFCRSFMWLEVLLQLLLTNMYHFTDKYIFPHNYFLNGIQLN